MKNILYTIILSLKKILLILVVILIITAYFYLPTREKDNFARNIIEQYKYQSQFVLVNTFKFGDLSNPFTWFNPKTEHFHYVSPLGYPYGAYTYGGDDVNTFLSEKHWYGEKDKRIQIVDVDCNEKLMEISEPIDGVFKQTVTGEKMNSIEIKAYCETDYTKQYDIYFCKALEFMSIKEPTIQQAMDVDISCSEKAMGES